jgi:hypothetical protein
MANEGTGVLQGVSRDLSGGRTARGRGTPDSKDSWQVKMNIILMDTVPNCVPVVFRLELCPLSHLKTLSSQQTNICYRKVH